MTTTPETTTDPRVEYIAGLRALADVLEANPHLRLPYDGSHKGAALAIMPHGDERQELADWVRALPGKKEKKDRGEYFDLNGTLHGLHIKVICDRDEVCERVVTGTREVTEDVRDPEALAAVPMITVTKTVEDVEWRCSSILAEASA